MLIHTLQIIRCLSGALALSALVLVAARVGAQTLPEFTVSRQEPVYPPDAASAGIHGRVVTSIVVDEEGVVQSVDIVEAIPPGVFEQAVRDALRGWRFKPPDGGQFKSRFNVTQSFRFGYEPQFRVAPIPPEYPQHAAILGVKGTVLARLVVDVDGKVKSVRILKSDPRGVFEDAVRERVRDWYFHPRCAKRFPMPFSIDTPFTFVPGDPQNLDPEALPSLMRFAGHLDREGRGSAYVPSDQMLMPTRHGVVERGGACSAKSKSGENVSVESETSTPSTAAARP